MGILQAQLLVHVANIDNLEISFSSQTSSSPSNDSHPTNTYLKSTLVLASVAQIRFMYVRKANGPCLAPTRPPFLLTPLGGDYYTLRKIQRANLRQTEIRQ